jgi:hypothetical protein
MPDVMLPPTPTFEFNFFSQHETFKQNPGSIIIESRVNPLHQGRIQVKPAFSALPKKNGKALSSMQCLDIKIIKSPVGMPGRTIENRFLKDVASGKKQSRKCSWQCLKSCDIKTAPYCLSLALDNARKGILDKGFAFGGSNTYRIDKIISTKELLMELKKQYLCAREKSISDLRGEYEKALERLVSFKEEYLTGL